jgi:hypothetical protein
LIISRLFLLSSKSNFKVPIIVENAFTTLSRISKILLKEQDDEEECWNPLPVVVLALFGGRKLRNMSSSSSEVLLLVVEGDEHTT